MKRSLILVICMVLFLTGCGKELSPIEQLKEVSKNETSCESFNMKMNINFKLQQDGMSMDMNMPISIGYANEVAKIEIGENLFLDEMELYVDKNKVYMSSKIIDSSLGIVMDEEYYIVEEVEETEKDSTVSEVSSEEIDKILDMIGEENITLISTDGDIKQYRIVLKGEALEYLYNLEENEDSKKELESAGIDLNSFELSMDIYVNTKTNTFVKCTIDMMDIFKKMIEISVEEMDEETKEQFEMFKKFSLSIELSDCNTATVVVPDEIKNNAITSEEYGQIVADSMDDEYYYDTDLDFDYDNYIEEL